MPWQVFTGAGINIEAIGHNLIQLHDKGGMTGAGRTGDRLGRGRPSYG